MFIKFNCLSREVASHIYLYFISRSKGFHRDKQRTLDDGNINISQEFDPVICRIWANYSKSLELPGSFSLSFRR
jgi:hypothetical protein